MKVLQIDLKDFKRFSDLTITGIPVTAKLVVLAGPNGTGKSSLFDAFRTYQGLRGTGANMDHTYHAKKGIENQDWERMVDITFDQPWPHDQDARRKAFYFRSAYRNVPDFNLDRLQRIGPIYEHHQLFRLIDDDKAVDMNYRALVSRTIAGVFDRQHDETTVEELRESVVGIVRESVLRIFPHLELTGLGDPLENGSFYFTKGESRDFHYKNLSGGEKAAFDLILDLVLKRTYYDDTVFCIDEPESHLNTRVQAKLLQELVALIPEQCQLWIASHSIGMMKSARDLKKAAPEAVSFLDFEESDFDQRTELTPVVVDRDFWNRTLQVAMDDLASLVAPERVVLCEGSFAASGTTNAEFDASCL